MHQKTTVSKRQNWFPEPGTTVNLVLSGGGMKGVAHVALLRFLEDHDVRIGTIAGASAGALVGSLYQAGLSTDEILQAFKNTNVLRLSCFNPLGNGLFVSTKYESIFEALLPATFEELSGKLIIATTDLNHNRPRYFSTGNLYAPLMASCAIPGVFTPVEIDGRQYVDGGVTDNFPVEPLLDRESPIIGSYVSKPSKRSPQELDTLLKVTYQANLLLLYTANRAKFKLVDVLFDFPTADFGLFNTKEVDSIYKVAMEYLQEREVAFAKA